MLKTFFTNYNSKTTEHFQNIAINSLDIDSLQSREDSPFFDAKKHKPQSPAKTLQAGGLCWYFSIKSKLTEL